MIMYLMALHRREKSITVFVETYSFDPFNMNEKLSVSYQWIPVFTVSK